MKRAMIVLNVVIPSLLMGEIAFVTTERGESFVVPFNEKNSEIALNDYEMKKHGQPLQHPRNYASEVSQSERSDIHYIMTTLANNSLISIAFHRSSLESAGDRIDHLHPLRFLMTVFTDEEMKVCMRNIRGRGWIWGDFVGGMKESLHAEANLGNMKKEFVDEFAKKIEVNPALLYPHIEKRDWDELVETLIQKVPRKGDFERYDS